MNLYFIPYNGWDNLCVYAKVLVFELIYVCM